MPTMLRDTDMPGQLFSTEEAEQLLRTDLQSQTGEQLFSPELAMKLPRSVPLGTPGNMLWTPKEDPDDSFIMEINRAVLLDGTSIDKIKQLLEIKAQIRAQRALEAFNEDFANLQSEIPIIKNDSTAKAGSYDYEYASLEAIMAVVRPLLGKYGFSFTHSIEQPTGQVVVHTTLMHRRGHHLVVRIGLNVDNSGGKNGVQAVGSSQMYGMRYNVRALLNIATKADDDDGIEGGGVPTGALTQEEVDALQKGIKKCDEKHKVNDTGSRLFTYMNVEDIRKIERKEFQKAYNFLKSILYSAPPAAENTSAGGQS